jgi:uncharacterized protein
VTIDVNVHLSRWPFRRLSCDEPAELVARLRRLGVQSAWAGSFDALLHRDLANANSRLLEDCRKHGKDFLVPFGTVNPLMPFWEDDYNRCKEMKMPGLQLYPAWHGYSFNHPEFVKLLRKAAGDGMIVQIDLRIEDERTQHPLLRLQPVDPAPLPEVVATVPRLRLVLLNHFSIVKPDILRKAVAAGQVFIDIATVEGVGGIAKLLETVPAARVLFGSHYPFFYFESAELKMKESNLEPAVEKAIRIDNAQRLLARGE